MARKPQKKPQKTGGNKPQKPAPQPKPIEAFKRQNQQEVVFASKRSGIFAVGIQETIDDGMIVGAHAKGHDVNEARQFGVRPGNAENVVIDGEGVWNVEDWLDRNGATHVCAHRTREMATCLNKGGVEVVPSVDPRGFDQDRRKAIEDAAKVARKKKIPQLVEKYIDDPEPMPAGP